MTDTPWVLIFIALVLLLVLGVTGIWWLQATVAEAGRRANPSNAERDERLEELASERASARRIARIVAPVSAVALAIVVVLAIWT